MIDINNFNNVIEECIFLYKNSNEYAKRCLLGLNDTVIIQIDDEKLLKQGLLSIHYIDDNSVIEVHITTDFVKSNNTYDFKAFCKSFINKRYNFVLDKLGVCWESDKDSSGEVHLYDLLYSLVEQENIKLNCILPNSILHEINIEFDDIERGLNKEIRELSFYITIIENNHKNLKNSTFCFSGYNRLESSYFINLLNIQKENIILKIDKLILYVLDESEYYDVNKASEIALENFIKYVQMVENIIPISCIGINCDDIDKDRYINTLLSNLYNLFKEFNMSMKPEIYISMLYDYVDSDMLYFYKSIMNQTLSYKDLFDFNIIEEEIKELEQRV